MAGSLNKVILVGNLGADPEVRKTQAGDSVTNFSVATSENWKDQTGQKQERTEWHRVVLFGKIADVAGNYLKKGSKVLIEGQLRTRKWQNQNGQDQYTTEVVVSGFGGNMTMLDSAGTYSQQQNPAQQTDSPSQHPQSPDDNVFADAGVSSNPDSLTTKEGFSDLDDEIPF